MVKADISLWLGAKKGDRDVGDSESSTPYKPLYQAIQTIMIACLSTSCGACEERTDWCPVSQGNIPQPLNPGDKRSFLALQMMCKGRAIFPSFHEHMNNKPLLRCFSA